MSLSVEETESRLIYDARPLNKRCKTVHAWMDERQSSALERKPEPSRSRPSVPRFSLGSPRLSPSLLFVLRTSFQTTGITAWVRHNYSSIVYYLVCTE